MRGGDTSALRAFNQRLIIGAIRERGPMSKAEVARATGLSAQAASVIMQSLVEEGLLILQDKVRGMIGQPSTPMALNPQGAYSVGVKIGRRSVEAVLIDFLGRQVAHREVGFAAPLPEVALPAALNCARAVLAAAPCGRDRIAGLGLAMPGELHAWSRELGLEPDALADWRGLDVAACLAEATGLAATPYNDATAACAAEMALGEAVDAPTVLYLYLGTFVGGGLVLDGRLYRGNRGNAAALGSMPMGAGPTGAPRQLIHAASLCLLEQRLAALGLDPGAATGDPAPGTAAAAAVADWSAEAAEALARAVVSVAAVVDVETVVLDGLPSRARLAALADAVTQALGRFDRTGLSPFALRLGSLGRPARVLGAALLPLYERFSPDPDVLTRRRPVELDTAV